MSAVISLAQGDQLPVLTDSLTNADGTAFNLTGFTVKLRYQNLRTNRVAIRDATITGLPTAGTVSYAWNTLDATDIGDCRGQWIVTKTSTLQVQSFDEFDFKLYLPSSSIQNITAFRPYIRTLLGDNNPDVKEYAAEQIDDAVRLVINLGKVPDVSLTADGMNLTPAVLPDPTDTDKTLAWSRVVLHAASRFILANGNAYAFRTRALSEVFGEQREMVFDILNQIVEMEFSEQAY